MNFYEFLDRCSYIARDHIRSRRIENENDVSVKSGIPAFGNAFEYRDQYIIISCALDVPALYVEAIQPINKIIALVDGRGVVVTAENEYQYLIGHVDALYGQVNR